MIEMPEAAILVLHFQEKASPEQEETLRKWRNSAAENESIYAHLRLIWEQAGDSSAIPKMDLQLGWSRLSQTLDLERPSTITHEKVLPMPLPTKNRLLGWPLALAAVLATALLWFWMANPWAAKEFSVATIAGEQRELVLEDGSKVWLDSGSKLTHIVGFKGKSRQVNLDGHAFFEVAKGAKSFVVQTSSASIRVLGTEFDVWAGNGKTKVIVREGRVSLSGLSGEKSVELGPNQYSECTLDGLLLQPLVIDAESLLAWLQGSRIYHRKPLGDVVHDLGRFFGTKIEVSDPELAQQTITATFREESLSDILKEICLTLNMEFMEKEGGFILKPVR